MRAQDRPVLCPFSYGLSPVADPLRPAAAGFPIAGLSDRTVFGSFRACCRQVRRDDFRFFSFFVAVLVDGTALGPPGPKGRLRVSSLRAVIFFRSVVFRKGRFMRSFPFPDRYRIGPGIFGMRSVSPVPSGSCSVACLVRSFCGSGGGEVASACADSSRLGMFSGYRLYTFLYRPSSSRCFRFPGIRLPTAERFGAEA